MKHLRKPVFLLAFVLSLLSALQPAQPTHAEHEQGRCPTTGEIQGMLMLSVVHLDTEHCGFTWRSINLFGQSNPQWVWLPPDFIATMHLADDDAVVVAIGGPGADFFIDGGTFRWMAAYPPGDPARDNPCSMVQSEIAFGRRERPSFPVLTHGFTCAGVPVHTGIGTPQPPPMPGPFPPPPPGPPPPGPQPPPPTTGGCPTTPQEAANLMGGAAQNWRELPNTNREGWKYEGPSVMLKAPGFGRIDHPGGAIRNGQTITTNVATLWCRG